MEQQEDVEMEESVVEEKVVYWMIKKPKEVCPAHLPAFYI